MLYVAAKTDVGMLREHNEDSLGMLAQDGLFVVADGMGGHASGEGASRIAIDTVLECFQDGIDVSEPEEGLGFAKTEVLYGGKGEVADEGASSMLESSIKLANLRIFETGTSEQAHKGMGTTIVAMKVSQGTAHLAHVGDSRIYLYRGGDLLHMTRDHSWFADLMANAHEFTPQTLAYAARYKNVITRALGMEASVEVDLAQVDLEDGDVFLLCSDGLHDMIEDDEIAEVLSRDEALDDRCAALIRAANNAGGDDNISVILVEASSASQLEGEEE